MNKFPCLNNIRIFVSSVGSIISGQTMAGSDRASTSGRSGTTRRNIDADDVLDDSDDSSDDEGY